MSEARCGYVDDPGSLIDLKWINVYAPGAGPASGKTSQKVTWSVTIQRMPISGGAWSKVVTSPVQTGTATTSSSPNFTAIKVKFQGANGFFYRAVSKLSWLTQGSVTGYVKLAPDWYATSHNGQNGTVVLQHYCRPLRRLALPTQALFDDENFRDFVA